MVNRGHAVRWLRAFICWSGAIASFRAYSQIDVNTLLPGDLPGLKLSVGGRVLSTDNTWKNKTSPDGRVASYWIDFGIFEGMVSEKKDRFLATFKDQSGFVNYMIYLPGVDDQASKIGYARTATLIKMNDGYPDYIAQCRIRFRPIKEFENTHAGAESRPCAAVDAKTCQSLAEKCGFSSIQKFVSSSTASDKLTGFMNTQEYNDLTFKTAKANETTFKAALNKIDVPEASTIEVDAKKDDPFLKNSLFSAKDILSDCKAFVTGSDGTEMSELNGQKPAHP